MARKTYLPRLARLINVVCKYITKYQATLIPELQANGDTAAVAALNAAQTACTALSKYLIHYEQ